MQITRAPKYEPPIVITLSIEEARELCSALGNMESRGTETFDFKLYDALLAFV